MHPSHNTARSQHGSNAPHSARSEQKHTSTSSFVSTLSNALDISTPTSSRKAALPSSTQSTPTRHANAATSAHQPTPTRPDAVRTPIRAADAPRILTLSGHEAFQSPTTPVSPWTSASVVGPPRHSDHAIHGSTASQNETTSRAPEHDQDWLMSGSSSRRIFNIFTSRSKTNVATAQASQLDSSTDSEAVESGHSFMLNSSTQQQSLQSSSAPFHVYREQPSSDPRVNVHNFSKAPSDGLTSRAVLSPTSAAALSPTHSSTFPAALNHASFMSAMFEQDTPSLSTHLLPDQDLTEQLHFGAPLASARPFSASAHSLNFTIQPNQPAFNSQHGRGSTQPGNPHDFGSDTNKAASRTAGLSSSTRISLSLPLQPAPRIVSRRTVPAALASDTEASAQQATRHNGNQVGDGLTSDGEPQTRTVGGEDIAGLGLQFNAVPVSQVEAVELIAPASANSYRSSVLVDEMGRWILDSDGRPIAASDHSSLSTTDSSGRRVAWHGKDASNTSLGATTEASLTSHSNSSTWDTSFYDVSSSMSEPPSASADSQYIRTPASSFGLSFNTQPNKLDARPSAAMQIMTPEVAMHDFSEFGQSVSIEQMADERWRTWPRNRDSVLRERPFDTTVPMSPNTAAQTQTDERTSIDSLSVSASSTRSRLMAEPYNKNLRSGRPSSSASTSSRSSIGNAAFEIQSTGVTGPTRPSYIATGSLRMSSGARTGSSGGAITDGVPAGGERVSGTALALRRARGMSQGGPPPSSSAMKLTRSSDALVASAASSTKFRHSVALQRTALSSDGLKQGVQRPQSLLETSSNKPLAGKVGFNEVSVALDTLRIFLKQKEGDNVDPHHDTTLLSVESNQGSEPKSSRTLRRTKAILPPRGAFSAVDEFGTLQTNSTGASVGHSQSQTDGSGGQIAILEDLSERVLRLKAETEQHAAQSMPPPSTRTRREMHEEYLRKRANQP